MKLIFSKKFRVLVALVLGRSKFENSSKLELLDFIKNKCEFEKYHQMIPKSSEVVDFKFRVKTKLFKLSPYNYYRMYDLLKNEK
jgi:hypothetical protein